MFTPHVTVLEASLWLCGGREEKELRVMIRESICKVFVVCKVKCLPPIGVAKSFVYPTSDSLVGP